MDLCGAIWHRYVTKEEKNFTIISKQRIKNIIKNWSKTRDCQNSRVRHDGDMWIAEEEK